MVVGGCVDLPVNKKFPEFGHADESRQVSDVAHAVACKFYHVATVRLYKTGLYSDPLQARYFNSTLCLVIRAGRSNQWPVIGSFSIKNYRLSLTFLPFFWHHS